MTVVEDDETATGTAIKLLKRVARSRDLRPHIAAACDSQFLGIAQRRGDLIISRTSAVTAKLKELGQSESCEDPQKQDHGNQFDQGKTCFMYLLS